MVQRSVSTSESTCIEMDLKVNVGASERVAAMLHRPAPHQVTRLMHVHTSAAGPHHIKRNISKFGFAWHSKLAGQ